MCVWDGHSVCSHHCVSSSILFLTNVPNYITLFCCCRCDASCVNRVLHENARIPHSDEIKHINFSVCAVLAIEECMFVCFAVVFFIRPVPVLPGHML